MVPFVIYPPDWFELHSSIKSATYQDGKVFTVGVKFDILFHAMPITSSAIKKSRQDTVARERNRIIRDEYKKAAKTVRKYAEDGDMKKAQEALKEAYSKIDKAAKKNILHKNNASRRKSRLSALLKVKNAKPPVAVKKASKTAPKKPVKKS